MGRQGIKRRPHSALVILAAASVIALVGVTATAGTGSNSDTLEILDEPWRTGDRQRREEQLENVVSSLRQVREAEAKAADHEENVGADKMKEAAHAKQEAANFMAKAKKLLGSERALQREQIGVEKRLDDLEAAHSNVKLWMECARGDVGCREGDSRDEWEREEGVPRTPISSALRRLQRLRQRAQAAGEPDAGQDSAILRGRKKEGKRKMDQERDKREPADSVKGPPIISRPRQHAADLRPKGHPYANTEWKDRKPGLKWQAIKAGALKAGYDLSNCFAAAAKDPAQVTVKIVSRDEVTIQKTAQGCTCKFPWKYYKEAEDIDGAVVEKDHMHEYDRCSANGSSKDKLWCATDSDECGQVSEDAHAGHGRGKYGWTRWDYCLKKATSGYQNVVKWESTHSAAEVSCLANFFLSSDRALEWRALDLLQQEAAGTGSAALLPPAEVASRYEHCVMRVEVGGSAVYCEADMLRHLRAGVVRHALLISRADQVGVHWANRQRVILLFAEHMRRCLDAAADVGAGIVCMSQMVSSMPYKVAHRALVNARDITESGEPPQEVSALTAKLVACVRAAADDDAEGFCLATFLSHVPHRTLQAVQRMAARARAFGSMGFPDNGGHGGSGDWGARHRFGPGRSVHAGWVGLEDINAQAHNHHLWHARGRYGYGRQHYAEQRAVPAA
jgi:hypothetical protein